MIGLKDIGTKLNYMEKNEMAKEQKLPSKSRWLMYLFSGMAFIIAFLYFGGAILARESNPGYFVHGSKIAYLVVVGIALAIQCVSLFLTSFDIKKEYSKLTLIHGLVVAVYILVEIVLLVILVFVW